MNWNSNVGVHRNSKAGEGKVGWCLDKSAKLALAFDLADKLFSGKVFARNQNVIDDSHSKKFCRPGFHLKERLWYKSCLNEPYAGKSDQSATATWNSDWQAHMPKLTDASSSIFGIHGEVSQ